MTDSTIQAKAALYVLALDGQTSAPADRELLQWLSDQELVTFDNGIPEILERGKVWASMLSSTPVPVAVARWGDPRQFPPVQPIAINSAPAVRTLADRPAAAPAPVVDRNADLEPPPGFNVNRWNDLEPGNLPPGAARDTEVECVWRNGKRVINFAGVVLWKHMGKPEDVMFFRVVPPAA